MTDHSPGAKPPGWIRITFNILACAAILAASGGAILWINATEPTAQQINTTRKSAALVETVCAECGDFSPKLVVLGTVTPAQDITLSPRVSGQVVDLSSEFVPGGMVSQGDRLLRIDPADFENALSISESELKQAQASLEIEEGRQSLAKKELELLEGSINETNRALVLREPQIASIRAQVAAAEAAVQRAELNLDRASVYAPFDAQILNRSVNIGSQVTTGADLARLVGIDEYWIMAALPVRSLRWVQFPTEGSSFGSKVTLRNPDSWPENAERIGKVTKMIGTVDEQTRLARVLITVPDPLGLEIDGPPLILNTLIETEIEGRVIKDVCRLERQYVRNADTVWVMKDDKLEIRDVEIVFRDAQYAYIKSGLADGDEIVTTTLATVADGVGLRKVNTVDDPEPASGDVDPEVQLEEPLSSEDQNKDDVPLSQDRDLESEQTDAAVEQNPESDTVDSDALESESTEEETDESIDKTDAIDETELPEESAS